MADRTGQELGNYRLTRLLGRGGFAEVYLGEHMRLKTQAAIKVLYAQLDSDNSEEFLQEAQTVAHLIHPNIVRIFDFDVREGVPFLVMDYAPGGTLRQRHPKNTRLPLETIIPYIKQVADALQYAHDEKFIHRDIKPENILVGRSGEILLSDFGIALIAQSTHMQSTQAVMGTAYYMAPEQLQGKPRQRPVRAGRRRLRMAQWLAPLSWLLQRNRQPAHVRPTHPFARKTANALTHHRRSRHDRPCQRPQKALWKC